MLAIDTNVVVRYLTADHPEQSERARRLMNGRDVWLATTVLLESEWVLRSAYGYKRPQVAQALRRFCGLARVAVENPPLAARALDWAEQGLDFADALHLAAAGGCEAFITFDEGMIRAAESLETLAVRQPD